MARVLHEGIREHPAGVAREIGKSGDKAIRGKGEVER
jgi:hypothetical protein